MSETEHQSSSKKPLRELVLDTETTGMHIDDGNRIIEIGIVELVNGKSTGNNYHVYVDPERETEDGALDVHGWDRESLILASEGKKFRDRSKELLDYIADDSILVIHNAPFDMGYLDMEFERLGMGEKFLSQKVKVFDTLSYANIVHPGKQNNLDALCKRYKVDNSSRDLHGALLDAKLLADVYIGMKTPENDQKIRKSTPVHIPSVISKTPISQALSDRQKVVKASTSELENHKKMFDKQLSGTSPW